MRGLPRQLASLKPARGVIKADYEDFVVDEVPLYAASGKGDHTYFLVEKRGLNTNQAIADIAKALGVPRHAIGFCGLKDARAVTRQWMSVEHTPAERINALRIPRIRILETTRHTNKLRLGHLVGNRFRIRVRETEQHRFPELRAGLERLIRDGAPNYFGPQRFGGRGDTWETGRAVIRNKLEHALDFVLGKPSEHDHGPVLKAREFYERGEFSEALRRWPGMFRDERRALRALTRNRGNKRKAFHAIDPRLRRLYLSAYQSHLFNQVVAARMQHGLGKLVEGDLAWRHDSGAVFHVEDLAAEQPRADAFEISPSGPLFGYRMTEPSGEAAELEAELLERESLDPEQFRSKDARMNGERRPLRFRVADAEIKLGADARGAYFQLGFLLPRGCYATCLLRELFTEESTLIRESAGPHEPTAQDVAR